MSAKWEHAITGIIFQELSLVTTNCPFKPQKKLAQNVQDDCMPQFPHSRHMMGIVAQAESTADSGTIVPWQSWQLEIHNTPLKFVILYFTADIVL